MTKQGTILLEALVGLALLASAGLAALSAVSSSIAAERRFQTAENEISRADRLLTGWSLLAGPELARRVGATDAGEFTVVTTRPERGLYRLAVSPVRAPDLELLATIVYRPDGAR